MKAKLIVLNSAVVLSLGILLMGRSCNACSSANLTDATVRQQPILFVYTRPDAPNVHIAIRQDPTGSPLLSDTQVQELTAMLNALPASQLQNVPSIAFMSDAYFKKYPGYSEGGQTAGGHTFGDGNIIINEASLADPEWLARGVTHEIGHTVEYKLSDSVRQQWIKLHNGSQVPFDVFTPYSLTDDCEDFAETYRFFAYDTESNLKVAIRNAGDGHSKELDKMLFMASLFITGDTSTPDYDGTITFYKPDPADNTYSDPYKVPYTKSKDAFQMDGYTFALSGSNITQITDASGDILASNISVPLVPPYWPKKTVVTAAPTNPNPTPTPQPRNPKLPSPEISAADDSSVGSPEAVIGGGPDNYVPLTADTANSQLHNLQVNGIRAGDVPGAAVHGGTAVRIPSLNSSSSPSSIVSPNSAADVIEFPSTPSGSLDSQANTANSTADSTSGNQVPDPSLPIPSNTAVVDATQAANSALVALQTALTGTTQAARAVLAASQSQLAGDIQQTDSVLTAAQNQLQITLRSAGAAFATLNALAPNNPQAASSVQIALQSQLASTLQAANTALAATQNQPGNNAGTLAGIIANLQKLINPSSTGAQNQLASDLQATNAAVASAQSALAGASRVADAALEAFQKQLATVTQSGYSNLHSAENSLVGALQK